MTDDYWWLIIRTLSIFSSAHQATQVSDWWWLMTEEQWAGIRERIRLEAYTFSNRREMRQHLPTGYDIYLSPPGWKPVPLILWYLVLASSQQSYATITVPRTTSTVTQSIGLQPMQWWWIVDYAVVYCSFHQAMRGADYWLLITDYWWLMTDYWFCSHGKCGWHGGERSAAGGRFCGETAIVINWTAIERKIFF